MPDLFLYHVTEMIYSQRHTVGWPRRQSLFGSDRRRMLAWWHHEPPVSCLLKAVRCRRRLRKAKGAPEQITRNFEEEADRCYLKAAEFCLIGVQSAEWVEDFIENPRQGMNQVRSLNVRHGEELVVRQDQLRHGKRTLHRTEQSECWTILLQYEKLKLWYGYSVQLFPWSLVTVEVMHSLNLHEICRHFECDSRHNILTERIGGDLFSSLFFRPFSDETVLKRTNPISFRANADKFCDDLSISLIIRNACSVFEMGSLVQWFSWTCWNNQKTTRR